MSFKLTHTHHLYRKELMQSSGSWQERRTRTNLAGGDHVNAERGISTRQPVEGELRDLHSQIAKLFKGRLQIRTRPITSISPNERGRKDGQVRGSVRAYAMGDVHREAKHDIGGEGDEIHIEHFRNKGEGPRDPQVALNNLGRWQAFKGKTHALRARSP